MKKKVVSLFLCLLFFLLLLFPGVLESGAKEGLYLWYSTIVPILFPFILISNLLLATDSIRYFTYPFLPVLKHLKYCNPHFPYAFLFGWFCGYPMGAKTVTDLCSSGKITQREGNFLLPAVNQASPMFLMGYLGIHIFKNRYSFGKILFFIYFPVLVYCLFGFILLSFESKEDSSPFCNQKKAENSNFLPFSLEDVIFSSFQIMVTIGVYMMIFTIFMRLFLLLLPNQKFFHLALGFLEMSTGISWLSGYPNVSSFFCDCLILSVAAFGGLCTLAQTFHIIKESGLSPLSYFLCKLCLALSTFFTAYFFL